MRKQCHGNRRELRRARRGVDFGIKLLFESIEVVEHAWVSSALKDGTVMSKCAEAMRSLAASMQKDRVSGARQWALCQRVAAGQKRITKSRARDFRAARRLGAACEQRELAKTVTHAL